jgi:hypothetical protein
MYISTRERDRLNKLKKQQQKAEDAALKICKQRMVNHANQQSSVQNQVMFQRTCPICDNIINIQGEAKKCFGRDVTCPHCKGLSSIGCLGNYEKHPKPGILSRIADGFAKAYEEEQIQKEKNSKAWIGIVGFAIGAYIGLTRNRHK